MNMGDAFGDSPFQQAAHRYPSFDEDDDDAEEVRPLALPLIYRMVSFSSF